MPSGLSWLDSSRDEQQRIRDMLKLFSDTESRDELGIGQVRDAFSDALFPGTSVIQTRARYLLIVPWCHQEAEQRGLRGNRFTARVDRVERMVVQSLLKADDTEGVIGRRAGVGVKTLPSSIYGAALLRYGIRTGEDGTAARRSRLAEALADAEELTQRVGGAWHPTLPPAPDGFPNEVEGGLRLRPEEARWLRERMLTTAPGTLLAHLLDPTYQPVVGSWAPWNDPAVASAPVDIGLLVQHAARFSMAMLGAALLYNLLVAERYEQAGLTEHKEPTSWYREELSEWTEDLAAETGLATWDRKDMWMRVVAQNPRIAANGAARQFVDRWLDAVAVGDVTGAADNMALRSLVAERERSIKKGQSRLVNEKLLRTWSGASGSRQLVFRWPQVRRMLSDIHDGCAAELSEVAHAGA
jgi:hypothetical protein